MTKTCLPISLAIGIALLLITNFAYADGFSVNHDWTFKMFGDRVGLLEKALASDFENTVYTRIYFGGKVLQLSYRIEYVVLMGVTIFILLSSAVIFVARRKNA